MYLQIELGTARMQTLQSFVRDLGRGLVVSGGERISYGLGSYANTPLEETLPVTMDIPQHKDTPSLAVVLIIESLEAPLPVNISKVAAEGVINLLTPEDQVGISAGYGTLAIPMQHVTDKATINKAINAMQERREGAVAERVAAHGGLAGTEPGAGMRRVWDARFGRGPGAEVGRTVCPGVDRAVGAGLRVNLAGREDAAGRVEHVEARSGACSEAHR